MSSNEKHDGPSSDESLERDIAIESHEIQSADELSETLKSMIDNGEPL
ncbi:hypothetical protein [Brevibacterium zhoupengii]|nr:hypothetical protein [Brevibacterium zhoupengii]